MTRPSGVTTCAKRPSPRQICSSEPQILVRVTLSVSPPGRGSGTGNSAISNGLPGSKNNAARLVMTPPWRPQTTGYRQRGARGTRCGARAVDVRRVYGSAVVLASGGIPRTSSAHGSSTTRDENALATVRSREGSSRVGGSGKRVPISSWWTARRSSRSQPSVSRQTLRKRALSSFSTPSRLARPSRRPACTIAPPIAYEPMPR